MQKYSSGNNLKSYLDHKVLALKKVKIKQVIFLAIKSKITRIKTDRNKIFNIFESQNYFDFKIIIFPILNKYKQISISNILFNFFCIANSLHSKSLGCY